jgi:endonuclease G
MMKLKLTSLFILLPLLLQSQVIKTDIFTVEYDQKKEQPLWVEYTVQCPKGDASRQGMDFYTESNIHTSDNDDYKNNIWDKGHLAPAASFNCDEETLYKTFTYLNSALQHQGLNRGVWKELEGFERDLANFYEVKVRVEVYFSNQKVLGGATIPSGFRKIITFTKGTKWINYLVE